MAGQARQSGRRAVLIVAVAGIVCGDVLLITLSAAGFAVLMQSLPWLLPAMRVLGAAYLLYLGIAILRSSAAPAQQPSPAHAGFTRGLLMTISNPKPVLFFSTFFPLFIPASQSSVVQGFVMLGLVFESINVLYFVLLCSLLTWANKRLSQQSSSGWLRRLQAGGIQKICGGGLLLCGLVMGLNW
ncbi:LysE family translocator [Undibacterium hunanense]|uniref:LysE family translocator n=1 Tax=Undibacterium hunanense TaxID=2762292 RepID=UPI002E36AB0A|nr:LysE family translocator [Undibacterium hunanense]